MRRLPIIPFRLSLETHMLDFFSISLPLLALLLFVPLIGILEAMVPWLVKDRECFAVTIPSAAARDPRLVAYKRMYSIVMVVAAVIAFAVCLPIASGDANRLGIVILVTTFAQIGLGFLLMLAFRQRVRAIKRVEGWEAEAAESVAVSIDDLPRPLPLRWEWLHVAIIAASLALTWALYPQMPDQIIQHVDFNGMPTDYMPKSPMSALFPVAVTAFMAAIMTCSHAMIVRSKRPVDPESPATSSLAYALFARMQSIVLYASGILLTSVIGLSMPLAFAEVVPMDVMGSFVIVAVLVIVLASVWVAVVYGQSGARAIKQDVASGAMPMDEDRMWLAGIFYCNPYDPSIIVPKRFGVGWTINVGRPGGWAIIIGLLAASAAFVVLTMLLTR